MSTAWYTAVPSASKDDLEAGKMEDQSSFFFLLVACFALLSSVCFNILIYFLIFIIF